jgi:AraC family transcriptional regulator of adaptative response/methylated-DNA-[protein]-cysteine methyltransferase
MTDHDTLNYQRIETAIHFITENLNMQPSLDEIAASVHLSPFHFQRLFKEWAGVSPKKFMQFLSLSYAKERLRNNDSVLKTTYDTGLSSPSRLHDLFIGIEGMTPGEYKHGGSGLHINYSFSPSPFGQLIVASTPKGVCHLHFDNDNERAFSVLRARFPNASYREVRDDYQHAAVSIFDSDWRQLDTIKLHLAGTPFQHKVWESLLKIPTGALRTYSDIAQDIGNNKASRAVGSAVGKNPVAFLIPCHRVIQKSGHIGNYMWGSTKKRAIIGWEGALPPLYNELGRVEQSLKPGN